MFILSLKKNLGFELDSSEAPKRLASVSKARGLKSPNFTPSSIQETHSEFLGSPSVLCNFFSEAFKQHVLQIILRRSWLPSSRNFCSWRVVSVRQWYFYYFISILLDILFFSRILFFQLGPNILSVLVILTKEHLKNPVHLCSFSGLTKKIYSDSYDTLVYQWRCTGPERIGSDNRAVNGDS